jgi:branched-chain amino acid transport system permease protein
MVDVSIFANVFLDIVVFALIYLIISLGLNLQYGYAGIPNFGIVASVEVGAVIPPLLTRLIAMVYSIDPNLNFINDNWRIVSQINLRFSNYPLEAMLAFAASVIVALLAGAAIGFIMTYPAIRLKANYLLMALIAMSESIRIIGTYYEPIAGGTAGIGIPDPFIWLDTLRPIGLTMIYLAITVMIFLFVTRMTNSPFGRLLRAVRENEVTVSSVGKKAVNIKMITMVLGSMLASLAGVLVSFYMGATIPTAYTRTDWTFWPWLMVMVGGIGNNLGVVVGVVSIVSITRTVAMTKHYFAPFLPFDVIYLENILLGIALILMIAFRPKGILPEKPIRTVDTDKIRKQETPQSSQNYERTNVT